MEDFKLLWMCMAFFVVSGLGNCGVRAQSASFWNDQAQDTLQKALTREATLNRNVAKNIVIFIGDGMGMSTVTAARIHKGQLAGMPGEETVLEWEKFPSVALSRTYTADSQVPDSAGTGTAIFCGVKANFYLVGLDSSAQYEDCRSSLNASVNSVLIDAQKAGKATGFVTTTRVTHGTPATLYAHTPSRFWENDAEIPPEEAAHGCTDIAHQLVTFGKDIQVIMGGGRLEMLPNTTADFEYPNISIGYRRDGRNLIDEWTTSKDAQSSRFVWNLDQFNEVDHEDIDYLLGLFETGDMQLDLNRPNDVGGEPSIAEMTEKAIKILQKDKDGFFLMVEGGRIDYSHHVGKARHALSETLALEEAVTKAIEMTNEEDTLVIVTSDHGHPMTINGYPPRGNPILGLSTFRPDDFKAGLPFTTLGYYNGIGAHYEKYSFIVDGHRRNLTGVDTEHPDFVQSAIIDTPYGTHSGDDVAIYAKGPMSHLFHGVHEQNYIAHVMRYAACLGDKAQHCKDYITPCGGGAIGAGSGGGPAVYALLVQVILGVLVIYYPPILFYQILCFVNVLAYFIRKDNYFKIF